MRYLLCLFLIVVSFGRAYAENLSFSGALVERTECVVNNNRVIDIDFGPNIGVGKVDGINYRKNINYMLDCTSAGPGGGLGLVISGQVFTWDGSAIETSNSDLGVKFLVGDKPIKLDQRIEINPTSLPKLDVVLIKRPGSALKAGGFYASATLLAMYN